MEYKSFDDFWGEFLQVTFHLENPDLWPSRHHKANWCQKNWKLKPGSKILDLGCGDGLVSIWLSRMGFEVTGVDRSRTVLNLAREIDDTQNVNFIVSDLKDVYLHEDSFDAILFLDASGLMMKSEDSKLLGKAFTWLKPGGKLVWDCPLIVEENNSWSQEFPIGLISGKTSFDKEARIQKLEFFLKSKSGDEYGLQDTAYRAQEKGSGIFRYLYPKREALTMFETVGFVTQEIPHYFPRNYFALMGSK